MKRADQTWFKIINGERQGWVADTVRILLFLLSLFYRCAIRTRNWAFDSGWLRCHRLSAPILSVGNLTVGGTGKTPFVIWLAERIAVGYQVAVVSRGYGLRNGALNDEGLEIQQRLPQVIQSQNPDRIAAAQNAIGQFKPGTDSNQNRGVVILDDGFQHRRLARDLDIVLVDATRPFGFDYLIPRGLLREPVDGIRRANLVVLTRANLVTAEQRSLIQHRLRKWNPNLMWAESELIGSGWLSAVREKQPLDFLANARLFVFCGIGNPEGFLATLANEAFAVEGAMFFKDHHHYLKSDFQTVLRQARQLHCDAIVCTPKDLVKLNVPVDCQPPVYALLTGIRISTGADIIEQAISSVLPELEDTGRDEPAKSVAHL